MLSVSYAECQLFSVSFMLSVTYKRFMLSAVMLSVTYKRFMLSVSYADYQLC
jgi:hypothetical protein